ncbi:RimK family alpha-L-glutamate ligase [Camelliibacillus cellulosilyticus]|uniref:RimK family alpha-L-glutamate ligase n=1 Tax=Camelliibacillus cellulosilyticus TaxID=2174486 RepID=A0ABV9GK84_9BACL
MKLMTFNPLRTIGMPNVKYIKPEHLFRHKEEILAVDWVLFPEYWQVGTLVYGWKKRIFPSAACYHLGHNKIEMTRVLEGVCPEHVPYTKILANTATNREFVLDTFTFPFIGKEARNSMGRGVYLIENEKQFNEYASNVDVIYVQEKLDIDRDLRLTLVGKNVVAAYWRIAQEGHFLNNVAQGGTISYDPVPREIIDLIENVAVALNINHAGFDIAIENGWPYIFEFNVLFGNQGLNQLDISIEDHILRYLESEEPRSTPPYSPIGPYHFPKTS